MNKTKIIVVEDNIVYCEYVCNMLSREGYRNMKAYHLSTAKKHLQQATDNDIVVADLRLPDGSGIDLLCWMRKEGKMQPFIIMTDYAEVNTAVESMKLGSIDYIPKQLVEDKLVPLIRSILKERQAGQRRMPIFAREGSAFQKIMHRIRLVAATDMSVMIFGENGTGKEHIAHLLHDKSKRAGKPFVAVDCGSLSKELAPSAFFGHVKGAFTGADNAKKGYFHEAEGGTLFLDEVGNLALETQQMLLRAIQERRYRPVGDKADRNFNVRIIAATNEDLEVSVNEKRFRQDLLYRLHDFGITVPPLRDCQEDIMPLAEFFRDMANRELECSVSGFSSEARKALLTHAWPGNVRELRQKVMGAVLQAQEGVVMKEHLELAVTKPTSTVSFALRNDAEDKERFDNTPLTIYICEGEEKEIKKWFKIINIQGVPLNEQELLNALYSGDFVTALKKEYSNSQNSHLQIWSHYIRGDVKRQDILATALKWVSKDHVEDYMSKHRKDKDISETKAYFETVIGWASSIFITLYPQQCGLEWGELYEKYHEQAFDPKKVDEEVERLMGDFFVKDKKGIFEYVLGGCQDNSLLNIRCFDEPVKRAVYKRQTDDAKANGISNCPYCAQLEGAAHTKIWKFNEMDADHVTAWSKGGATDAANCQMLCKTHNRSKGNR